MRLSPEQRSLVADAYIRGIKVDWISRVFGTSQKTIRKWTKRTRFIDRVRKPKVSKVTIEVELAILAIRALFKWGTARIQQGLIDLPDFAGKALQNTVENVHLSRTTINNVLRKHKLNGYLNEAKKWKFFRAKAPNELWQLDLKGPFTVQGKKYYFLICIDDYSRYMLLAKQFEHVLTTKQIFSAIEALGVRPKSILTDNGAQFRKEWTVLCKEKSIEPLFAHPYYPQDKGKVERAIRTISEEFIHLLVKFPQWLNGVIGEYVKWYNEKRFHRGINTVPQALYGKLET